MSTVHAVFHPRQPFAPALIEQMLQASAYWQPDATGRLANEDRTCFLAKATLFNTERSKKDSVYRDPCSGDIIAANARIDNRKEIAEKLALDPSEFAQMTDSRLILLAYQRWREHCPAQLLGDFVFIIWDEARRHLFTARDHFGVKAVYYSQNSKGCMVTNEHNAFFTAAWLPKAIEEEWLVRRLWGLGPKPVESPYHGIEVLPPAHYLVIDRQGMRLARYWSLQDSDDWAGRDDTALIGELKHRFEQAVKRRLDSAYPLGTELSEGLDSNGIAGYAARLLGRQPLYTFSYNCQALTDDNLAVWEQTYKDIVAMLDMHSNLSPVWTEAVLPERPHALAELYHRLGGVMDFSGDLLARTRLAGQRGVRVLLSGWGGDHCVSANGNFYESELFRQGKWVLLTRHMKAKSHRRTGRERDVVKNWGALLLKHLAPALYRWQGRYRYRLERTLWQSAELNPLKECYITGYRCRERLSEFTANYQRDSVKAFHRRELFDIGVEKRLLESELSARLFRVEYRFPMLDVPLVELAYNMPSHLKMHRGIDRYMFRCLLEGATTRRIQWRDKADVDNPRIDLEARWQAKALRLREALKQSRLAQEYYDQERLNRVLSQSPLRITPQMMRKMQLVLDLEAQQGGVDTMPIRINSRLP